MAKTKRISISRKLGCVLHDSTHSYPKVAATAGTGVQQRWTRAFREI
jgi:hypothetical protein